MSERGEEGCGLLEEPETESSPPRRPPRQSMGFSELLASVSKWTVLASLVLATVLALPLLAYTRHERLPIAKHENEKQIALALHPEQHVTRGPATLVFNWTITLGTRAPDGVEKEVYLVNGQFPGPTVEARSGDRIIVDVSNRLESEGLAIHWHGLQMKGHNNMDGAVGFTQCPIPPGESFIYGFAIGKKEHDSLLINGQGHFNCSMAIPARPLVCRQISPTDIDPIFGAREKSPMRLRIVNTGTIAGFYFSVNGASVQPLAVDGACAVDARPGRSVGILYPGERIDLALSWQAGGDRKPSVNIYLDDENFSGFPNDALSPNQSFVALPEAKRGFRVEDTPLLQLGPDHRDLGSLTALSTPTAALPAKAQQTILLYMKTQKLSRFENKPLGAEGRDGWGSYNPFESKHPPAINLENPLIKDTIIVPRRGHVVVRLTADNPGIWAIHCHMLVHMGTGMVAGLHVGTSEDFDHVHDIESAAARLCKDGGGLL
ncbi:multicopper oxidase domain-containing protein [Hirsutella rhossiliensis]|uniref:Multicopper oxidase domain-containing protein n=1 Tax=Hirsutella rhossiliensis TaxID=111463 RepID=A0A9P8SFC0_9HYPO|nr:multicopper oxidase domain-containing protein [Hirsutella rhossiliensis]KAH0958866.1 multicopper oxidase domain-containing protein [Hirsutella rhossiliensis]